MKETWVRISDRLLQDYVDGRLTAEKARRVAAYLETHPKAAKAVRDMKRQNDRLRRLERDALDEPIPARLRDTLRKKN